MIAPQAFAVHPGLGHMTRRRSSSELSPEAREAKYSKFDRADVSVRAERRFGPESVTQEAWAEHDARVFPWRPVPADRGFA